MRGRRWRAPAGSRAKLGITVVFASLGLLAAACSGSPAAVHGAQAGPGKEGAAPAAAANAAKIKITPANGRSAARPNRGIAVSVADGKLQSVVVTAGSAHVSGTLATGSTSWHT